VFGHAKNCEAGGALRARLQDVAELAGVSSKTVSNVANGYPHIREATRAKVLRAMDQLNYRANLSARNLAKGRTGVIALAVPRLANPYFAEFAGQLIAAAEAKSWTVLIDETQGDPERERRIIEGIGPHLIDGVIISIAGLNRRMLKELRPAGALVLLGERIFAGPADHIAADNVAAARTLTEHLIQGGRRRIATIGMKGTPLRGTPQLRLKGYKDALTQAGLPVEDERIRAVQHYGRADGAEATERLLGLKSRPDAILCFNDEMAIGALHAIWHAGLAVPDDIAVAGFDDTDESRFSVPSLTSVSWNNPEMAKAAVQHLHDRIDQRVEIPPREVEVPFELKIRGSTSP
jgi:DNA-binding LacI/PurR family transcriptional regulator